MPKEAAAPAGAQGVAVRIETDLVVAYLNTLGADLRRLELKQHRDTLDKNKVFALGWGLGLVWQDLCGEGCRLGIVDAIGVRHLKPTSREYDRRPEAARVQRLLRERGLPQQAQSA